MCGWPGERITILDNPDSAADLGALLHELATNTTGVLLVYFACHAVLPTGRPYLAMRCTDLDRPDSGLRGRV